MTPEQWQRMKEVFLAALDRPESERSDFLSEVCGEDSELRSEVEGLLAADGAAENDSLMRTRKPIDFPHDESPAIPPIVGHYEILREIGAGGMGAVFLAKRADDQFSQRVAVKVIKRGMDTDGIVRRFRLERQILATLDHPNIGRLFDGGVTPDGRPYFVMEFIEGEPIDQYCARWGFGLTERLALFRTVCSAVQYAHQNLVIHRDIKPGNILVSKDGVPKLLDFGIAKLLRQDAEPDAMTAFETRPEERVLTPAYASPEQLRGERIATTSDVYSLGVVLFKMLTGTLPFKLEGKTLDEIIAIVCTTEPRRPSAAAADEAARDARPPTLHSPSDTQPNRTSETLPGAGQTRQIRKRLAGDLDTIILMALRKEPDRRYASVEQFSDDIRRHLEGLPVRAQRDTVRYRTWKFIRRNRLPVFAVAMVFLTLLGGIAGTLWQARRAERRFSEVRKLANVLFEFDDAVKDLPGTTRARALVVKRGIDYFDSLASEAGNDRGLKQEIAASYMKVGDVQGNPNNPNIGDTAGALVSYGKSQAITDELLKAKPTPDLLALRALGREKTGDVLRWMGKTEEALASYRSAIEVRRSMPPSDSDIARNLQKIGDVLAELGKWKESLEIQREGLGIRKKLADSDPTNPVFQRDIATSYECVGQTLQWSGEKQSALDHFNTAREIFERLSASRPNDVQVRQGLALVYERIGDVTGNPQFPNVGGSFAESRQLYERALEIRKSLRAIDPNNAPARRYLAATYLRLADALNAGKDSAGALADFGEAGKIYDELEREDPTNAQVRRDRGLTIARIAGTYQQLERYDEAIRNYRAALDIFLKLSEGDPNSAKFLRDVGAGYISLADTYFEMAEKSKKPDQYREAADWYRKSRETFLTLRQQNKLSKYDEKLPELIAGQISKCEANFKGK